MSERAPLSDEMIAETRRRIRNARDNARAEQAVHDAFIGEYKLGISGNPAASSETNKRSHELYDFTIKGLHRKRGFEADADLYEALLRAAGIEVRDITP